MFIKNTTALILFLAIFISTALAGNLQDAEKAIAEKDYSTAIIHLKNLLKETPKNAQARFLLGTAYLNKGDLAASSKEFGRAHKYAPDDVQILLNYAEILQLTGKQKKMISLLKQPLADKQSEIRRLNLIAYAQLKLEQLVDAQEIFVQANQIKANPTSYNGLASISMIEKDYAQSDELIAKALEIEPENQASLQLKAKWYNANKEHDKALEIYNNLLEITPENISLRVERAATLSILQRDEAAKADVKIILQRVNNHPQANFILAQLLLRERDFSGAQTAAQNVLNVIPKHLPAAYILGAANYALKNYNQAEEYLTIYLASNPANLNAQNLLANVYLALEKPHQSILILEGIPQKALQKSPRTMLTLGTAYAQAGETQKAINTLHDAQLLAPENQDIRKRLISVQLKSGEMESAIEELEQLAESQSGATSEQTKINNLLIISYIKDKQYVQAENKVDQLLIEAPEDITLLNLQALLTQLQGDIETSLKQYQQIAKKYPENIPAYLGMVRIAIIQSKYQEAEKYFQQIIKIDPGVIKAYLGLAAIAEKQKDSDLAEQYFWQALEQSKNNLTTQLTVAGLFNRWYSSKQQPEKVLELAELLDKQHPANNKVRSLLAQAQLLNQQNAEAEVTLKRIIIFNKKDIEHRKLLAQLININPLRTKEALDVLDDALIANSDNMSLYLLKASFLVKSKQYEDALDIASGMQRDFPNVQTGHLLEADIYRIQKQYDKALPIYEKVYQEEPSKKILLAIVEAQVVLENPYEAIELLTEALEKTPEDTDVLFKLASLYQETLQMDQAEEFYQRLLKVNPKHVIALNNLAWIILETEIKEALMLAQQAHELAPKSAAITDTYGYFLVRDGQYKQGLKLLKEASAALPNENDIQYHLAYAYYKTGDQQKASDILKTIIYAEKNFSEQEKANDLYQKLKK